MPLTPREQRCAALWESYSPETKRALINIDVEATIRNSGIFLGEMLTLRCTGSAVTSRTVTDSPDRPWDHILNLMRDAPWTKGTIMQICDERSISTYQTSRAIAESRAETREIQIIQIEDFKHVLFVAALLRRLAQAAAGAEHHVDHLLHVTVVRRWDMLLVEGEGREPHRPHFDMSADWSNWAKSLECCGDVHLKSSSELLQEEQSRVSPQDSAVELMQIDSSTRPVGRGEGLAEQGSQQHANDNDLYNEY